MSRFHGNALREEKEDVTIDSGSDSGSEPHYTTPLQKRGRPLNSRILPAQIIRVDDDSPPSTPPIRVLSTWNTFKKKIPNKLTKLRASQPLFSDTENRDPEETQIDDCSSGEEDSPSRTQKSKGSYAQTPTELDLLLALIESENKHSSKKIRKSCRKKDGFVAQLRETLKSASSEAKFLEYDKKFGVASMGQFEVLGMETSFGVTIARVCTVTSPANGSLWESETDSYCKFILSAEMASKVEVGSKLEAFFSIEAPTYSTVSGDNETEECYLQPHKLLLLS